MTYRQIFDEAIGEPPPTSIAIDQVVARERRRARMRHTGVAGTAAVAVLAATFGMGALRDGIPFATASPTSLAASASQSAGVEADRQRIRTAMLAAIDRNAPGLGWVTGASPASDTWNGTVTSKPEWQVNQLAYQSGRPGWIGWGVAARNGIRAYFSITIHAVDQPAASLTCSARSRDCATSTGPNGERVISVDLDAFKDAPPGPAKPLAARLAQVVRPDGTRVWLTMMSATDEFLLTREQMTAIALDPALTLR